MTRSRTRIKVTFSDAELASVKIMAKRAGKKVAAFVRWRATQQPQQQDARALHTLLLDLKKTSPHLAEQILVLYRQATSEPHQVAS